MVKIETPIDNLKHNKQWKRLHEGNSSLDIVYEFRDRVDLLGIDKIDIEVVRMDIYYVGALFERINIT